MKKLLLSLALLAVPFLVTPATAQVIQCKATAASQSSTLYTETGTGAVNCDRSGAVRITGSITASPASVSATGAAVPASGDYIAGNKAGTLTGLTLDASSYLNVDIQTITGSLPAGSAVIGHVIADTGSTTAVTGNVATTAADGSNVTLGANADAASATGTIAAKLRFIASTGIPITGTVTVGSHAVTNAGTFATQSAITAASGSIASGSIASGAVASGAFSSGSVASGAFASGSVTDGAVVTLGAKTDAKSTATDATSITAMQVLKEISAMAQAPAALPANQSTNIAQIVGTTADTNSGTKSAGTLRVVIATDQPALTNKLLVTPDSVALPANQSVNVAQMNGVATTMGNGVAGTGVQRVAIASDNTAFPVNATLQAGTAVVGQTFGAAGTITSTSTRPADVNAYAINDNWSDSTSAPTAGGFTFTSICRTSGGSGLITDMIAVSSNDPATLLQGELWLYDTAVTAVNDNAAFASSDSDTLLLVGVIPFGLLSTAGGASTTSYAHVQNLSVGYTCAGTANLRYKVKVKNAYTPASAETLSFRLKYMQTN